MEETNASSGRNTALKVIVPLVIIGGLFAWNYTRAQSTMTEECMKGLSASMPDQAEAICSCASDQFMDEISVLTFVPLVGRVFRPSDEEARKIGEKAGYDCALKELSQQ